MRKTDFICSRGLSDDEFKKEDESRFQDAPPTPLSAAVQEVNLKRDFWDETTAIGMLFQVQPHDRIWTWAEKPRPNGRPVRAAHICRVREDLRSWDLPKNEEGLFRRNDLLDLVNEHVKHGYPCVDPVRINELCTITIRRPEAKLSKVSEVERRQRTVALSLLVFAQTLNENERRQYSTVCKAMEKSAREILLKVPAANKKGVQVGFKTLERDLRAGLELLGIRGLFFG